MNTTGSFTATSLLKEISTLFRDREVPEHAAEAELLICHALGISRTVLYRDDPAVDGSAAEAICTLARRRLRGEPLQYLTGSVEFCGLSFRVGRGVLIPRPETELLVEEAVWTAGVLGIAGPGILDLGTGSGCVAVAVARALPLSRVVATDLSAAAVGYARENAGLNGAQNVVVLEGDLFEPVRGRRFDLILSNPPYVKACEMPLLQKEIRLHEPAEALDGGPDGLSFYRRILEGAPLHLRDGGAVVVELGAGQAEEVAGIARGAGMEVVKIARDLSGMERVMVLSMAGSDAGKVSWKNC